MKNSMTLKEIFNLGIKMGVSADPRTGESLKRFLDERKEEYNSLSEQNKELYDKERMIHPYSDSRILCGNKDLAIHTVLAGIELRKTEDLLLAKELERDCAKIDLVITHHPIGFGRPFLTDVMQIQIDLLEGYGVPVNITEKHTKEKMAAITRKYHSCNNYESTQTAKLLHIPFMCLHTPFDNIGWEFLTKHLNNKELFYIKDVLTAIEEVEEYKITAQKYKFRPSIFAGSRNNRCGKVVISDFTGGTNVSEKLYGEMVKAGIGTIIGMHFSEDHIKEARQYNLNIVAAPHMASDSIGYNLFLDEIENQGIRVIPCSGLVRVKRT